MALSLGALSPSVMGIVNVTPDSFFAAARTAAFDEAIVRGTELFTLGCDIVDVGGESTRPGAREVALEEELARVVPVVSALALRGPVSIDTRKADVARAAVRAGAVVINDVSGTLMEVAGELGVGYVAMHARGTPENMQDDPRYDDVVAEVLEVLASMARRARDAGVAQLWLDPGIGFGKTLEHNVALVARCADVVELARTFDAGVVIGTSRKRFLGLLGSDVLEVDERLEGSLATEAWALVSGVSMIRAHDAPAALQLRELVARPVAEVGA
ncbi:MAG: dihydropteroate synthase [Actinomycetota bacterium]|nr:dihydropteroate synthase [Actinomycetota bacterium]